MIIIEIQKAEQVAIVPPLYKEVKNEAEQAYHQALAAAAVSTIPIHSVTMLDDEGRLIKQETYYHEA